MGIVEETVEDGVAESDRDVASGVQPFPRASRRPQPGVANQHDRREARLPGGPIVTVVIRE